MKISKEKLLSLISENNYISDIDEMAKYWEKKKPGKMVKASNIYDDQGDLITMIQRTLVKYYVEKEFK
jgi:hypothetical protein